MLQSMTGYGRATGTILNKKISVEVRSLNSRGTDVYLKTPNAFKSYELPIRKMIGESLKRGKIECFITEESIEGKANVSLNKELFVAYYHEIKSLATTVGEKSTDVLAAVLRIPEVLHPAEQEVSEEEWEEVERLLKEAIKNAIAFRVEEGKSLILDFQNSLDEIEKLLQEVPKYEELRIEIIRERMKKAFEKLSEEVDGNRFEQELIYYIEKLDINEEKKRLQHHIDYFRTTMNTEEASGKKLGFITQELGREINTLGSKSYHVELQKIVVEMKDYLEKIKEQVNNTL